MTLPITPASRYPLLLSPIEVGGQVLRNRVIMGSMHTRLEHMDQPVLREAAFYAERARGGAALIITGGFAPNEAGRMEPGAPILATRDEADHLRHIADAVHRHDGKLLLQILHSGRYARHDNIRGVSAIRSPINRLTPVPLTAAEIERTIDDFGACAELAQLAGFDGVEIMGSEGYLINQFMAPRTNNRTDCWGGSLDNRCRFSVEAIRTVRERCGSRFLVMYRISAIDLVEGGSTADEIAYLARAVEAAGADILNTGYGWHEAPVPTIAYQVPRAAWRFGAARLKREVAIPVVASNRINTPEMAEEILAAGDADLVSMARPFLADPDFVAKAASGRTDEINTCIACNQACLDHIFTNRVATCLVNPKACREIEFDETPPLRRLRIAIIGAGPAGLACAINAGLRGHRVTLFEAGREIGGQLNLARRIPGKTEFNELLRYYDRQLELARVEVRLNTLADADALADGSYDHVVVATGIVPRTPEIAGIDHPKVASYLDIIMGRRLVAGKVAIIGAGGIGHDVAEFLLEAHEAQTPAEFFADWDVDPEAGAGLCPPIPLRAAREIMLLQRGTGRIGERLGKSTGWIVRGKLKKRGVISLAGATYRRIDDAGLHITVDGEDRVLDVDTVVICAGQDPSRQFAENLARRDIPFDIIGGASLAAELDAVRAIDEGTRLAYRL